VAKLAAIRFYAVANGVSKRSGEFFGSGHRWSTRLRSRIFISVRSEKLMASNNSGKFLESFLDFIKRETGVEASRSMTIEDLCAEAKLDSLDYLALVTEIRKEFGEVSSSDVALADTLGELMDAVKVRV
jgi:acyl carrier protein